METILELVHKIQNLSVQLEKEVNELHLPFSGMIDVEALTEAEQARNVDHFKDEQI